MANQTAQEELLLDIEPRPQAYISFILSRKKIWCGCRDPVSDRLGVVVATPCNSSTPCST